MDGYYSDTKISGSLETIGDNYIGGSWLRITIDGEEVATLGVQNLSEEQVPEGGIKRTYSLQSTLWMLDADLAFNLYTIAKNTKAKTGHRRHRGGHSKFTQSRKTPRLKQRWRQSERRAGKA